MTDTLPAAGQETGSGRLGRDELEKKIRDEQKKNEFTIAVFQTAVVFFWMILYLLAPKGIANSRFEPVLLVLGPLSLFMLFRVFLTFRFRLSYLATYLFILIDCFSVSVLIWAYHLQYEEPPAFYLKSPTFLYFFVIIGMRSLCLDVRSLLFAGLCVLTLWSGLTVYAVLSEGSVITHSYQEYMYNSWILIGAEVDKLLNITIFTLGISYSVYKFRRYFVSSSGKHIKFSKLLENQNRKLRKASSAAKAADEAKSSFLMLVSHELYTPLSAVIGYSAFLVEDRKASDPDYESLKQIHQQGEHLKSLIDRIILYSKLDQYQTGDASESVDLPEVLYEKISQSGLTFDCKGLDKRAELTGHKEFVGCLLEELFENCRKHAHAPFSASLESDEITKDLILTISDSGPGFRYDPILLLKGKFSQEKGPLEGKVSGIGIGLPLVDKLAKTLGLEVRFREKGAGSPGTDIVIRFNKERADSDK